MYQYGTLMHTGVPFQFYQEKYNISSLVIASTLVEMEWNNSTSIQT